MPLERERICRMTTNGKIISPDHPWFRVSAIPSEERLKGWKLLPGLCYLLFVLCVHTYTQTDTDINMGIHKDTDTLRHYVF